MSQLTNFLAFAEQTNKPIRVYHYSINPISSNVEAMIQTFSSDKFEILCDETGIEARSKNEGRVSVFIPVSSILWVSA